MSVRVLIVMPCKNMKKPSAFVLILSFLLLVLLPACNNSVDDMLEDYNGGFNKGYVTISGKAYKEYVPFSPGEEGFRAEDMLRDEYFVFMESTLILAGPPKNVYSYWWKVSDPENNETPVFVTTVNGSTSEQYFTIYLPESGLEVPKTYKLTLTIKSTGGETYTDSCSVVVYDRYVYDE